MPTTLLITGDGLRMREGPSTSAVVKVKLGKGTRVAQLEAAPGWFRVRTPEGTTGWISAQFAVPESAQPQPAPAPAPGSAFAWYRVARQEEGVSEVEGPKSNKRILEYHATCSLKATSDDVAWCSAFVNWCMQQAGVKGTNDAGARSWLNWGRAIQQPVEGCVAVLKRTDNPTKGHVAFFVRREGSNLILLGGNQGNRVREAPYDASRLLSFRLPKE
jgi:uncharacterized protein (TIGR02594 family)